MSEVAVNNAGSFPERVREYVDGLRDEMRLVTWPSWSQVRATTTVVIAAVFIFAAYFAVVDQLVNTAIERLFKNFAS